MILVTFSLNDALKDLINSFIYTFCFLLFLGAWSKLYFTITLYSNCRCKKRNFYNKQKLGFKRNINSDLLFPIKFNETIMLDDWKI